ncbi:MAG: hypothetical protein ACYC54_16060 [Sedimentisphaerales bacterium]
MVDDGDEKNANALDRIYIITKKISNSLLPKTRYSYFHSPIFRTKKILSLFTGVKTMKNYKVSIAIDGILSNFEISIPAKTKKQAEKQARKLYNSGEYNSDNITEPDFSDSSLTQDNNSVSIEEEENE